MPCCVYMCLLHMCQCVHVWIAARSSAAYYWLCLQLMVIHVPTPAVGGVIRMLAAQAHIVPYKSTDTQEFIQYPEKGRFLTSNFRAY